MHNTLQFLFGVTCLAASGLSLPSSPKYTFPFVCREGWGAKEATGHTPLTTPVSYVVVHHSYEPKACFNTRDCSQAMRSMQRYHQKDQGWVDIGYNFAVGSDGVVYEGRGWHNVGAHAVGYNVDSIGIVLIGDWVSEVPPKCQLEAVKKLISAGVYLGYIKPDHILIGHRQVSMTECPGDGLFNALSDWRNFESSYSSTS